MAVSEIQLKDGLVSMATSARVSPGRAAARLLLSVSTSAGAMSSWAATAAAVAAATDSAQWLSVKEETIFLQDGPIRVTNLAKLPSEILRAPEATDTNLKDF